MNFAVVCRYFGYLALGYALLPLLGASVAGAFGEFDLVKGFGVTFAVSLGLGVLAYATARRFDGHGMRVPGANSRDQDGPLILRGGGGHESLGRKEALFLVPVTWLLVPLLSSIPFVTSGVLGWLDAIFEMVSGFTTTGASVFGDVESLPKGLLFWRALTQWIGGIGIVALFVAVLPGLGVGAKHMFFAEAPGPEQEGFLPRIRSTAIRICVIYLILSVLFAVLLWTCGMTFFEAVCHLMAGISTGGYSTRNASIGSFASPLLPWVVILMMAVGGTNLSLFYLKVVHRKKTFLANTEFVSYLAMLAGGGIFLSLGQWTNGDGAAVYPAIRDGFFTAVSIQSSTGFATADFDRWSSFGKWLIVVLMFVGGSSGSTGGGFKVSRLVLIVKIARHVVSKTFHPKHVSVIRMDDHIIESDLRDSVLAMLVCYMGMVTISVLLVSAMGLDFQAAVGGTFASISNIGPAFSVIGPMGNYGGIPSGAKWVFIVDMLLGRLEFFPLLLLLYPAFWRK